MPHVYVCAWMLCCFHSHISTQTFRRALTASLDSCAELKSAPSVLQPFMAEFGGRCWKVMLSQSVWHWQSDRHCWHLSTNSKTGPLSSNQQLKAHCDSRWPGCHASHQYHCINQQAGHKSSPVFTEHSGQYSQLPGAMGHHQWHTQSYTGWTEMAESILWMGHWCQVTCHQCK